MTRDGEWLLKEKYGGEKSEAFFADCKRLAAGEPLAHIIGWVPFLGCNIYLSADSEFDPPIPSSRRHREFPSGDETGIKAKQFALIPRPETEYWTEQAIASIKALSPRQDLGSPLGLASGNVSILDLCAGSGCIGVAVAKYVPNAHVHLAELDARHLPTIKKNLTENTIIYDSEKYSVFQSDLFANISETYDMILSNPPYIDPALDRTESSVKDHEPHHALYGGEGGLELIEHIIAAAPKFLNQNGQLWLEHEPEQAAAIQLLATKHGFAPRTHIDQYNVARFSVLVVN